MQFIEVFFYLLCLAGIVGFCFVFPLKYNMYFENKYEVKAVNWPISIVTGCLIFAAILLQKSTFVFILLVLAIICAYIFSGWFCYTKSKEAGADINDIIIAVVAQIFSSLGIAFFVIILADYFTGRKRRRRR